MPLQATSGAASYDAFGGGVPAVPQYIEDVFSTYLYNGTSADQTITNGIDLAGKGGMVWVKARTAAADNVLYDTTRGMQYWVSSNRTLQQIDGSGSGYNLTANASGFGIVGNPQILNESPNTYASWTFREQPKFFDVVTYTGTGSNTTIAHNLGSVPACIMVKRTDTTGAWQVYHRSLANTEYLVLNTTAAKATGATRWNSTTPTSTVFSVGTDATVNASGGTYVAYLFAHDAGGFGLTGTDNVISCGSYTGTGATGNNVTLGYEPQWLMIKAAERAQDWFMFDVMRGMTTTGGTEEYLLANSSGAAGSGAFGINPTATGFDVNTAGTSFNASGEKYIYIAIRRGPMKVPTDATKVFKPVARSGTGSTATITAGFPVDLEISKTKTNPGPYGWFDRLRGATKWLTSSSDSAEATASDSLTSFASNTGVIAGADTTGLINYGSDTYANWMFQRAPSFMDEVCYTGTGSNRTLSHNLGVAPEMMIVKKRNNTGDWPIYQAALGATKIIELNSAGASSVSSTRWNNTAPTASVFTVGTHTSVNASGDTYVAYLFATCPGVSKVGSYTGTGTTKQVNCGFTGGARFVLIKRADSPAVGDWYVWDSARGIVSGNDPYLLLNTTGVDVTNTDYVDTYSAGFEISSTAPAAINASGGTFIFLAIA